MTAAALIETLNRLGVRLEAQGELLLFSPKSQVTPGLLEQLRRHKGEILAVLTTTTSAPAANVPKPEPDGRWIEWTESRPDGTAWLVLERVGERVVPWDDCAEWPTE
jgi:hypothetical protein